MSEPLEPSHPPQSALGDGGLLRRLGLFDCTMIVMGTIIGAGVFNTPTKIAFHMGSLGGVLAIWIAGGVIAMCGALVFAELGSLFPRAGGQYVFLREGFGRFVAFLFGWLLLAAINSGAIAYVANVFVDHLQELLAFAGHDPAWSQGERSSIAVAGIVVLALINIRGVRLGATVQNVAMLTKIVGIGMVIVLGTLAVAGALAPSPPPSTTVHDWTWSGIGISLLSVVFTYGGFQNVTAVAGEARDPQRTIPRAVLIGTVLVIALYIAMNASLIAILGVDGVANSKTPTMAAAGRVVSWGEPVVAALVMISTLAITQALLFVTPRIYYAMALDGVFFRAAAYVHPRWRTPVVAIALQAVFGCLHLFAGETLDLLQMVTIADFTFFVLCGITLFVFRARGVGGSAAYRAFGYPWLPAVFVLASLGIVINAVLNAEAIAVRRAGAIVAAGLVLYLVFGWLERRRRAA
ncbi:MAG: amino acid permease [Planctomycetota bacterium]